MSNIDITKLPIVKTIRYESKPTCRFCNSRMKFDSCNKSIACFKCEKCGALRGTLISILKNIREDWWNL